MAFQFAGVDLEITDEDGDPVASAILNKVDYTPAPEAADNKPAGKNQAVALEILERLKKTDGDKVPVSSWSKECRDAGMTKQRFYEVRVNLERSGKIRIQDDFVFSPVTISGPGPVTVPPLLYSGGDRTVTGITDKVTERTKPLPAVTVTKQGRGVENSTVSNGRPGTPGEPEIW
jgi:hypothetical protein